MRDLTEQTILVTGATDGLGKLVASRLASGGATVLLHGRNEDRLRATQEDIGAETGNGRSGVYLADLGSLQQVRSLAERVGSERDRLDALVNNAGVISQEHRTSEDGYELTFAVNYLSHFLLTRLLLPLLGDTARPASSTLPPWARARWTSTTSCWSWATTPCGVLPEQARPRSSSPSSSPNASEAR